MERPTAITVTEFARNLSRFINRVAFRRERFVLMRGGEPVAEIVPTPRGVRVRDLPGHLRSLPHLSPEEADAFARDIEIARAELFSVAEKDRWES